MRELSAAHTPRKPHLTGLPRMIYRRDNQECVQYHRSFKKAPRATAHFRTEDRGCNYKDLATVSNQCG
eukprot:m.742846 g.742846  ORF g.742846 m.742846 type:complete len:68 (+) comp23121_c1_seq15:3908-4111(+)